MKTIYLFIIFICLTHATVYSQGCLPEGITFTTQTQIDNFQTNHPNCTEIEGDVQIEGDEITNLNGLNVLTNIGGRLRFYTCTGLPDLTGLENLTTIEGDLIIYVWPNNTTSLSTLSGLDNLIFVGGAFEVTGTDILTNLSGLENLTTIGENIEIGGNEALINLSGFDNLTSIGGDIWIGENTVLQSLTGLEYLTTVGGSIDFYDNDALVNLMGISNIEAASIDNLSISYNSLLSSCAVQSVCDYLAIPGSNVDVYDNAPGCNSPEEVEDACISFVSELEGDHSISIYPNPATNEIFIENNNEVKFTDVIIYNTIGQIVLQEKELSDKIDISSLNRGLYFIEFVSNETKIRKKLIVN